MVICNVYVAVRCGAVRCEGRRRVGRLGWCVDGLAYMRMSFLGAGGEKDGRNGL